MRLRGWLAAPRVRLASAGEREARTQPAWRGTATRAGEDAASRSPGADRRARGVARRPLKCTSAAIALAFLWLPAAAWAGDTPVEDRTIPDRISAGGVELGGMVVRDAAELLSQRVGGRVQRDLVVLIAGRRLRLRAERSKVRLDALRTAKRAYFQGLVQRRERERSGSEGDDASESHDVGLAITHSAPTVRTFVRFVRAVVGRPARSARLRIGITRLRRTRSRTGLGIASTALRQQLTAALLDPSLPAEIRQRVRRVVPAVTTAQLRRRYPAIITIDRHNFKLRLFRRLRFSKSYGIALGAAGFDTPSGFFRVREKVVNPAWHAPNRPWAGAYAGQTIPGGAPNNPLKARWLGLANGVGIHGTAEEWSIGSRASHGCIRMRVRDVVDLYPRVPVGTTVRISR